MEFIQYNAPHSDIQIIASDVSDVFSYMGKIEESADVIYMAGSTNILNRSILKTIIYYAILYVHSTVA